MSPGLACIFALMRPHMMAAANVTELPVSHKKPDNDTTSILVFQLSAHHPGRGRFVSPGFFSILQTEIPTRGNCHHNRRDQPPPLIRDEDVPREIEVDREDFAFSRALAARAAFFHRAPQTLTVRCAPRCRHEA